MTQDELLHKWVEGTLTDEEADRFRKREEYADLQRLRQQMDQLEGPGFDKQAMLSQILATPKQKPETRVRPLGLSPVAWAIGIAASLLLISIIFWPKSSAPTRYLTNAGQTLEGNLPDGSTFALNGESSIQFDAANWDENRSLTLKGEGSFSVEKGTPFTVNTTAGSVEVLGTEFDVTETGSSLKVRCREGHVAIFDAAGTPLDSLTAGNALLVTDSRVVNSYTIPTSDTPDWKAGFSRFEQAPLPLIMQEIANRYSLVVMGEVPEMMLRADIPHDNLNRALENVLFPAGLTYALSVNQDTVYLKPPE